MHLLLLLAGRQRSVVGQQVPVAGDALMFNNLFFLSQSVAAWPSHVIAYSSPARSALHPLWPPPLVTTAKSIRGLRTHE